MLLIAPILLSHLSLCSIFLPSCSVFFYPELCSYAGVTHSGRDDAVFGWSIAGIFQGWPFAIYVLMAFVWLLTEAAWLIPRLTVRSSQSSELKQLQRVRHAWRVFYGLFTAMFQTYIIYTCVSFDILTSGLVFTG